MTRKVFVLPFVLCGLVGFGGASLSTQAHATSWMSWGQKKEKHQKPIPGMATPLAEKNGATPLTEAAPYDLNEENMGILADIIEEQVETVKRLRAQIEQREAEVAAQERLSAEKLARRKRELADLETKIKLKNNVRPDQERIVAPAAPQKPKGTAPTIKPYVVPPAPVNQWQAIMDAEKRNNPPRGNITVKPTPPAIVQQPAVPKK